MKTQSKGASCTWRKVRIEELFAPLEDARTLHQGWSPQCEKQPSPSEDSWGVLRTTSIQPWEFQPEHNKLLPSELEPRPLLEVKPGDILITCAGPRSRCGISCLVENTRGRLMISGKMYRFRTRPREVLPKYLVAFLQSDDAATAIDGMKTGGSESGLNLTHERFRQLLVPICPLTEQERIVGMLDKAFYGLASARANAEKNLQNARALFESHLQSVFNQCGPEWKKTTIGEQLTLQRGFDITKDQQSVGEVPVVSSGGIKSYHNQAMAKAPGIVIGRKGTLGKVFYLENDFWPHDTTLWVKDFKGNEPRFIYYLFLWLDVKALDSGAANPALNRNQVHPIAITWPHVAEQKKLVRTLDILQIETLRLAKLYEQKLAALEQLKKALLQRAFAGEL